MKEGTYPWRPKKIPAVGKDHLVLADWRLSVSPGRSIVEVRDQGAPERLCGRITHRAQRADGPTELVTHESGAVTPFPVTKDDAVLVGLITLDHMAGHPELLRFDLNHLLDLVGWHRNGQYRKKATQALERIAKMSSQFDRGVWYNRRDQSTEPYCGGVIAEVRVESTRGRSRRGDRPCRLQWTESFRQSLLDGNKLDIDLVLLRQFSKGSALQLFRHLNKVWFGGRRPSLYERDLKELATTHLMMAPSDWLKRNFTDVLKEHERIGTILPAPASERFAGTHKKYRARFAPGPAWKSQAKSAVKSNSDAEQLVVAYHQQRFGTKRCQPTKAELTAATQLLATSTLPELLLLLEAVVADVMAGAKKDLYFQYAVRHFELRLALRSKESDRLREEEAQRVAAQAARYELEQQERQAEQRRAERSAAWTQLPVDQKKRCVQRAYDKQRSDKGRERILNGSIETPPLEMLAEMELLVAELSSTHSPSTHARN